MVWCNIEYAVLDSSSDAYVLDKTSMYRKYVSFRSVFLDVVVMLEKKRLKEKKKLTKDKPIEALQTLQSLKRGTRKKEKCLAVDFVKSGRKSIHG